MEKPGPKFMNAFHSMQYQFQTLTNLQNIFLLRIAEYDISPSNLNYQQLVASI